MAAEASNSSSNANLVQVFVKTLSGDLLSIEVNPRGTKNQVEARVMEQLRKIAPEEFPEGKAVILTPIGRTEGNNGTNASVNKVVGNITQIVNEDVIMALVTDRVATLVDVHEQKGWGPGILAYEFDVKRKDGMRMLEAFDLEDQGMTPAELEELKQTMNQAYPIHRLVVHYYPPVKTHTYMVPYEEDLSILQDTDYNVLDNKVRFKYYYAHYGYNPGNNNEDARYDFYDPTPEGRAMNVGMIIYELTPETIRDIREQIRASVDTPADADIMTHSFGGRRRIKKTKKAKKSNKSKKVGVRSHTARYTTGAKRKGASKKRKGSSKNKKKTMKRRLRR